MLKIATKSNINRVRKTDNSASVIKVESAENIENIKDTEMSLTEKLAADLKMLRCILLLLPNERPIQVVKIIEKRLEQHFHEITNLKNPTLTDVTILAESFVNTYHIIAAPCGSHTIKEYLCIGEFFLTRSMILLKGKEVDSKTIVVAMETFNELSYVYTCHKDPIKSLQYLNKALELYNAYTKGQEYFPTPVDILHILGIEKQILNFPYLLDTKYMYTLRSLLILSNKVKHEINVKKIITLLYKLLKKHLRYVPVSLDTVSLVTDVIKVAQYFLSHSRFKDCKFYLNAACFIIRLLFNHFYSILVTRMPVKHLHLVYTLFRSIVSCILTSWVQYGLNLLYTSRKQLLKMENTDNLCEANNPKSKSAAKSVKQLTELLISQDIEEINEQIIYIDEENYITDYNDAKRIFTRILELVSYLKEDPLVSEQVASRAEIAQYTSRAYKYLALYENDKIKWFKLQKRRIEILEDCLKTLNMKKDEFVSSFIYFELAIVNSTILSMKIESSDRDKLIAKKLPEIDRLVKNTARYFHLYMANNKSTLYGLADEMINESYIVNSNLNIKCTPRKYAIF